jgi:hypothetical protein
MSERPEDAVRRAKDALAWTGQPDASWSILLQAELAEELPARVVTERLWRAVELHPALGPRPRAITIAEAELERTRRFFADEPYVEGGPTIRAAVTEGERSILLLAAHHGALDGLGLVALLGIALGSHVSSAARGVRRTAEPRSTPAWIAGRLTEALFGPPARVRPARRARRETGDIMMSTDTPILHGGTAALVAGVVRAVRAWNSASGGSMRRAVVGIGASSRAGHTPTLEHAGAWLRIRVNDPSLDATRRQLANAAAEPVGHIRALPPPLSSAGRLVAERLGSTVVVSNLSVLVGPPELLSVAFFPKAHGRSAVSLGAATVGSRTTVSLRAQARDFACADARRLLRVIARELEAPDAALADAAQGPLRVA